MDALDEVKNKAKRYAFLKYILEICNTIFLLFFLFAFAKIGFSKALASRLPSLPLYLLAFYLLYFALDLPINFYRSHVLEHRFALSNQKIGSWFFDQLKSGAISYLIVVILAGSFYYILSKYPYSWWFWVSLFWIFFSLFLTKIVPVAVIPLFFKYRRLGDIALKERILSLADRLEVKILDVYEIDFSKKTLKANAAFVGMGNTRRVLLADTLKNKYTQDEIEVILAHEFAHCRMKHLLKLVFFNSTSTVALFYLIFLSSGYSLGAFGFSSLEDLAALPVILIYFIIFGLITQPLSNYISRRFEKSADILAVKTTGLKNAFISAMEKLSDQNLADRKPHPIIKFFFFDHPPIDERIKLISKI
ncbi:MAG: M48 family metallopeptidase [Candidatus Omnitrophica bacterium]|nr:M48 family metallopeptidase [Candidatus Omnitrophota bacterium]